MDLFYIVYDIAVKTNFCNKYFWEWAIFLIWIVLLFKFSLKIILMGGFDCKNMSFCWVSIEWTIYLFLCNKRER